jgi:predicted enzyme related to lactoylglutathione lyase
MVNGLRTVIYKVPDLARARAWYSAAFQVKPYFDEPFYVGFSVGGYELGLDPSPNEAAAGPGGVVAYWGVQSIDDALRHFLQEGATLVATIQDVGDGIRVATVADPFGNRIGLIENPRFAVPSANDR